MVAASAAMIDVVLSLVLFLAGGLGFVFFAASRAPVGYEDETGFHYGPDQAQPEHDFHGTPVPHLSR